MNMRCSHEVKALTPEVYDLLRVDANRVGVDHERE